MTNSLYIISIPNLLFSLVPVIAVILIYYKWALGGGEVIHATLRMMVQLVLVGYALIFIFELTNIYLIYLLLLVMLLMASWIALNATKNLRREQYGKVFLALLLGGGTTLMLNIFAVIDPALWKNPTYLIPLAGMNFSSAMNTVSLAAERFQNEILEGASFEQARRAAFKASLIPRVNMFFAVGLVSFPGMMTGQILAGVSPLIAVRYQVMIMAMIFGASGLSSALYLSFQRKVNGHPPA